jgi:anthranilate synthase/aminodeoxychorismate synthase-like glutamine amidotransferase
MLLIIDNYDSFTYNLVQRLGELQPDIELAVFRNDALTVPQAAALKPSHLIISPGPCTPAEAGISNDLIRVFAGVVPILGVCLGHQCIGQVFGGEIVRSPRVMHGKTSMIHHHGRSIFRGLPNPFEATRYHSLIIRRETWHHPDFDLSAWTAEGEIMGIAALRRAVSSGKLPHFCGSAAAGQLPTTHTRKASSRAAAGLLTM